MNNIILVSLTFLFLSFNTGIIENNKVMSIDENNASTVVFKHYRTDVCSYADKSYEFEIYEDGDYYKKVLFTYDSNRWRAEGCALPSFTLCYECSINEAVKIYYKDKLERSASSISIEW